MTSLRGRLGMYLFNRSISINVRTDDGKVLMVDGIFLDSNHEICLTLGIDTEAYTIISASGELRRVPHSDCTLVQNRFEKLVGIDLNHHVRRQIQAAVGLDQGCTHLTDLTLECIKGIVQARFRLMRLTMGEQELKVRAQEYLAGTCQHFKRSKT